MVKQIVKDVFFLSQKSEPATKEDLQVGRDLMDTLRANRERCVGMAANMIGVCTRGNVATVCGVR
jgi:peptide deformylase